MTLEELRPGERGMVIAIRDEARLTRVMEMGLLPGTTVEVLRLAPLGDPMDLRVRGYRLSIRKAEASRVTIRRLTP